METTDKPRDSRLAFFGFFRTLLNLNPSFFSVVLLIVSPFSAHVKYTWVISIPATAPDLTVSLVPLNLSTRANVGQANCFVLRH